jgi:hypothetical protein
VPPIKNFVKFDEKFFPFISVNSLIEILESDRQVKQVRIMDFFWNGDKTKTRNEGRSEAAINDVILY